MHAAQVLLLHNAKVYLACRDQAKTEAVIRELEKQTQNTAIFLQLDLDNLQSVKAAAERFQK